MESRRRHVPSSAITSFIEPAHIEALLERWVPHASDRDFIARCILREGPAHHRGANYVLLRLLGQLLDRTSGDARPAPSGDEAQVDVPIRLPPAVAARHDDGSYPLRFPRRVLERLAAPGSVTLDAMIDCVTDGPPQHALANAAMLCLIDALLADGEAPRR